MADSAKSGSVSTQEVLRSKRTSDPRPTQVLPTDRITFEKQIEILKAYAAASESGTKPVSLQQVSELVRMAENTVSLSNSFLSSVKLIDKTERGYLPDAAAVEYLRALDWNAETAGRKLAARLEETWFGKALLPRLSYRPLDEQEALTALAEASSAGTRYKRKLAILLDYLELAKLIVRKDGRIVKTNSQVGVPEHGSQTMASSKPADEPPARPPRETRVATAFDQTPQGVINFNVSFKVDMSEVATWEPQQISAFFAGIAQVLAAKTNIEKEDEE